MAIWEGSGNVIALDVLRALTRDPDSAAAFADELAATRGASAVLDAHVERTLSLLGAPRRRGSARRAEPGAASQRVARCRVPGIADGSARARRRRRGVHRGAARRGSRGAVRRAAGGDGCRGHRRSPLNAEAPAGCLRAVLPSKHDSAGTRDAGLSAPRAGPDRPRLREAPRRAHDGGEGVHVRLSLLAPLPGRLRRDAVQLPDDPAHRAGDGAAARRIERHRCVHGGRLYVTRIVQLAVRRDRRRDLRRPTGRASTAR